MNKKRNKQTYSKYNYFNSSTDVPLTKEERNKKNKLRNDKFLYNAF